MKTMRINEHVTLKLPNESERYEVTINNFDKKVIDYYFEFVEPTPEEIQNIVDKLIRLGMITLDKNSRSTEVHILIWNIDETDELYIETYHLTDDDEDFSDYNMTMKYEEFLLIS